ALSSLQKAVRRGHGRNAAFWAGELYVSGLASIALRRLHIMTVEDVGLASPHAPFIAAAAKTMFLSMPEEAREPCAGPLAEPPQQLAFVCGLAHWVATLPKTRTSCQLPSFLRAKAEEQHRRGAPLAPCGAGDVGDALGALYAALAGRGAAACGDGAEPDGEFLLLEAAVLLRAYSFQLCQVNEAAALGPLFEELGRRMRAEEQRLRSVAPSAGAAVGGGSQPSPGGARSASDALSGYGAVRKMVSDLQHLSAGALASAARMVLHQALLLATRAHHLVRAGIIVTPGLASEALGLSRRGAGEGVLHPGDVVTVCGSCRLRRVDGRALARCNARDLCQHVRPVATSGPGQPLPLDLQACVRCLVQRSARLVPRDVFECLLRPACDPLGRYLCVPPYCVDVHTRRGSGWPMHEEWESRICAQFPALTAWDAQEVSKTHGVLDADGRAMARQFGRYGLIVADEYFPGPSRPTFDMELKPTGFEPSRVALSVAALDHGETFVDRRSFPGGYSAPWRATAQPAAPDAGAESGPVVDAQAQPGRNASEAMRAAFAGLPANDGPYCECADWDFYVSPATPQDPFFEAIRTFGQWAGEAGFPSRADFPGGRLPQVLESRKSSTINDDPQAKGGSLTQAEYLRCMVDDQANSAARVEERSAPIDARVSDVTELHRARMHESLLRERPAPPAATEVALEDCAQQPGPRTGKTPDGAPAEPRRWKAFGGALADAPAGAPRAGADGVASGRPAEGTGALLDCRPAGEGGGGGAAAAAAGAPGRKTRWGRK
ncbi:unnamed protein product, partial [Prorocentrum cordatum]